MRPIYPNHWWFSLDEFLRLFACVKSLPSKEIDELEGKLTGLRDHGEAITLKLVKLEHAWKESPDAKLLSSLALFDALKRCGKLWFNLTSLYTATCYSYCMYVEYKAEERLVKLAIAIQRSKKCCVMLSRVELTFMAGSLLLLLNGYSIPEEYLQHVESLIMKK